MVHKEGAGRGGKGPKNKKSKQNGEEKRHQKRQSAEKSAKSKDAGKKEKEKAPPQHKCDAANVSEISEPKVRHHKYCIYCNFNLFCHFHIIFHVLLKRWITLLLFRVFPIWVTLVSSTPQCNAFSAIPMWYNATSMKFRNKLKLHHSQPKLAKCKWRFGSITYRTFTYKVKMADTRNQNSWDNWTTNANFLCLCKLCKRLSFWRKTSKSARIVWPNRQEVGKY